MIWVAPGIWSKFVVHLVRQAFVRVLEVLNRETELFQVVRALHASSRFARRLDGRQEKPDQNADDRDDDEKFDQREAEQPPVRFDGASHKKNPFIRTTRRFPPLRLTGTKK